MGLSQNDIRTIWSLYYLLRWDQDKLGMAQFPNSLWERWRSKHVAKFHCIHPHMPSQRNVESARGTMPKNGSNEILVTDLTQVL